MADGQCYVAISRVPSLQGLFLLNFDKNKLKSSNKVKLDLQRIRQDMQLCTFYKELEDALNTDSRPLLIAVQNTRSLPAHHADLLCLPFLEECSAVCLTETWLTSKHTSSKYAMQNFQLVRKDRQLGSGGGVCTYVNTSVHCQPCEFTLDDTGVQFQCINIQTLNHAELCIVTVYRPPSSSLTPIQN